jgi:hypothetical protein
LNNGLAILQKTHIAQVEKDLLANKGLIATKEKEANQLKATKRQHGQRFFENFDH